jgi:GntR family transcriptional regulator
MPRPPIKALALASHIAAQIDQGILTPGAWLPSERDLATTHAMDRSTVRKAIELLQTEGRVVVHPGVGAQIAGTEVLQRSASDITRRVGQWRGFHVSALASGQRPYTHTTISEVEANPTVARWLAVPTQERVLERRRLQGLEEIGPIQISVSWIPLDVVAQVPILRQQNTGPGGIHERLEELGHNLEFEDTVTCRAPSPEERDILQTDDDAVLVVWRRCYNQDQKIMEANNRVIVSSRQEVIYRYGR